MSCRHVVFLSLTALLMSMTNSPAAGQGSGPGRPALHRERNVGQCWVSRVSGEPAPHTDFHRPISLLFNTCFRAGFVLDGFEEPVFPPEASGERWFSWANFKEIPPIFVARMRLPEGSTCGYPSLGDTSSIRTP